MPKLLLGWKKGSVFLVTAAVTLFGSTLYAQDDQSISTLRQMGKAFSSIAGKASPAVVGIKAEKISVQGNMPYWFFDDPFFKHFFGQPGMPQPRQQQPQQRKIVQPVQGSGFIISDDGYILTNNHLVGEAQNVKVQLNDDREFEAKIIGADPESDVAVIKIEQKNLPFLELADSDTLEVGEWVLAIGSPFGLSHTVTAGIVSAKGRSGVGITTYEDFIQTDAPINPGNSGGPLLNLDAKVVGINTAIISRSGGNMGIGLAIPVNMAKNIYKQLSKDGKVVRGYLGISLQDVSPDLAENFELNDSNGVIVTEVMKDSAAEKAGIKTEDIITELDGKTIEDRAELMNRVALLMPGTEVELTVLRDGKKKTLKATLGERPAQAEVQAKEEQPPTTVEDIGLKVENLTDEMAERFGYQGMQGVFIAEVKQGSVADNQGMQPGMLILKVNRKEVKNIQDFYQEIKGVERGQTAVFLITDGRSRGFVTLRVPEKE